VKVLTYVWRTCPECQAPAIRPLPVGWSYTVEKRRTGIHKVTVHLPQCRDGFKRVEIPDVDE